MQVPCKHGHVDGVMHVECSDCRVEALEKENASLKRSIKMLGFDPTTIALAEVTKKCYVLSEILVNEVFDVLVYYSHLSSYLPPHAPVLSFKAAYERPSAPTPEELTRNAIYALGLIRKEIPEPGNDRPSIIGSYKPLRGEAKTYTHIDDSPYMEVNIQEYAVAQLGAFKRVMEEHTIPAIVKVLDERAKAADKVSSGLNPSTLLNSFQYRINLWMQKCFGPLVSADRRERNFRFFEEAGELVQAGGMTAKEAHELVDYTWGRPVGELKQEVGGVRVTLAALCNAYGIDEDACAEMEAARVWTCIEKIRAKQASKTLRSFDSALP